MAKGLFCALCAWPVRTIISSLAKRIPPPNPLGGAIAAATATAARLSTSILDNSQRLPPHIRRIPLLEKSSAPRERNSDSAVQDSGPLACVTAWQLCMAIVFVVFVASAFLASVLL